MIQGSYFSFTSASVAANTDLMSVASAIVGKKVIARKLTLIASGSVAIDINNLGVSSTLFQDADNFYKLSLDSDDCVISSLIITETSASPVFLAMVF